MERSPAVVNVSNKTTKNLPEGRHIQLANGCEYEQNTTTTKVATFREYCK